MLLSNSIYWYFPIKTQGHMSKTLGIFHGISQEQSTQGRAGPWSCCLRGKQCFHLDPTVWISWPFLPLKNRPHPFLQESKAESPLLLRKPQFPFHSIVSLQLQGAVPSSTCLSPRSAPGGRKGPTLTCRKEIELLLNHC